jgi:hypothetical protein
MTATDDPFDVARATSGLVEAEREFWRLVEESKALAREGARSGLVKAAAYWGPGGAIGKTADWIAVTAPMTLADVAVKLRYLCHAAIGVEDHRDEDVLCLRQVLAYIEARCRAAPDRASLTGDAEVFALFETWCSATRAANAGGLTDEEAEVAVDRCNAAAEQLADLPVHTVEGLGLKAFMAAYYAKITRAERGADHCALGPADAYSSRIRVDGTETEEAHMFLDARMLRGLMASVAEFVPTLRPLVAAFVGSPVVVPLDDDK